MPSLDDSVSRERATANVASGARGWNRREETPKADEFPRGPGARFLGDRQETGGDKETFDMQSTRWGTWQAMTLAMVLMLSAAAAVAQHHEHGTNHGDESAAGGSRHHEHGADQAGEAAAGGEQHHDHGIRQEGDTEVFLVEGLRVDPEYPPGGSAVGRAGARLPGGGYLHVVYGKPYARGREIFGDVVDYEKIWVTGAHLSTELVVTVPVMVGGRHLDPGVYSLFTTPRRDRWTLHVNRGLGMHLAGEYDPQLDVVAVDAAPTVLEEPSPAFVIEFLPADGGVDLQIRWDRTAVSFPIRSH